MTPSFGLSRPGAGVGAEEDGLRGAEARWSAAETEEHHIPVPDHVLLALGPGQALFARRLPAADPHEVLVRHRLGPDEALFEVRMDHTRGRGCPIAAVDGPGPDLLLAGREVALKAEQVVGRVGQAIETGLGEA